MYNEYELYNSALAITGTRDQQLDRDYLEHHGILGMKWGIRRYQNEDGSLTPEGERRYRETGYGERLAVAKNVGDNSNMMWGSGGGAVGVAIATGYTLSQKKYYQKLKDMADNDARAFEQKLKNKNRKGAEISRGIFGSAMGAAGGITLGAMTAAALLGSPEMAMVGAAGGAMVGGALGGIGGAIIGRKQADKRWDKTMDRMRYIKRSKKELAEYDRQKAASDFQKPYNEAGGSLINDNANYDYDEYGRVKSAKVRL